MGSGERLWRSVSRASTGAWSLRPTSRRASRADSFVVRGAMARKDAARAAGVLRGRGARARRVAKIPMGATGMAGPTALVRCARRNGLLGFVRARRAQKGPLDDHRSARPQRPRRSDRPIPSGGRRLARPSRARALRSSQRIQGGKPAALSPAALARASLVLYVPCVTHCPPSASV